MHTLHKLTHKMQVGIPVAYNVCEVRPNKINYWIYVHREDKILCTHIQWFILSSFTSHTL